MVVPRAGGDPVHRGPSIRHYRLWNTGSPAFAFAGDDGLKTRIKINHMPTVHGVVFVVLGPDAYATVSACFAASNAASRAVNLPFANPARAMMVGIGSVSKK